MLTVRLTFPQLSVAVSCILLWKTVTSSRRHRDSRRSLTHSDHCRCHLDHISAAEAENAFFFLLLLLSKRSAVVNNFQISSPANSGKSFESFECTCESILLHTMEKLYYVNIQLHLLYLNRLFGLALYQRIITHWFHQLPHCF